MHVCFGRRRSDVPLEAEVRDVERGALGASTISRNRLLRAGGPTCSRSARHSRRGHRRCSAPRRRCRPAVSLPLRVLGFVFELGLRVQEERRYSQCFRAAAATASLVEGINQARGALNSRRCAGQMPALAALLLSSQPGRVLEVHFCSLAAMLAVVELCWSGGDLCCQN